MIERRKIVSLWRRGDSAALVTLVGIEGSSYRRAGARLLIASNGDYAGGISGGCLEAEVIRKAQWLTRNGAVVERYSTLFDDTAEIPYGLGCGGTVDLLLEPAGTPEFESLMHALEASLHGETFCVTTQLPAPKTRLARKISRTRSLGFNFEGMPESGPLPTAFTETLRPPQQLYLFGAGDDAQPMVRMAALLGWSVSVVDARPQWARAERFPEAERVVTTLDARTITNYDAVVLMSHSYEQDRDWLAAVLPARPRYLGLLGARHRSALLISEAAAQLRWSVDEVCTELFAPVGLDVGGDGASAIALATIAEIHACIEGKLGHSRRMTPDIVADQLGRVGASRYLQTECAL